MSHYNLPHIVAFLNPRFLVDDPLPRNIPRPNFQFKVNPEGLGQACRRVKALLRIITLAGQVCEAVEALREQMTPLLIEQTQSTRGIFGAERYRKYHCNCRLSTPLAGQRIALPLKHSVCLSYLGRAVHRLLEGIHFGLKLSNTLLRPP
jgi:hypothetical protein